jgi:hypothetical protein
MALPTYKTYDVLNTAAIKANPSISNNFLLVGKDFQTRTKYSFEEENDRLSSEFVLNGNAAIAEIRTFFRDKQGKLNIFWLPSWGDDFIVYENVGGGSVSIKVEKHNLVTELADHVRHIYIPSQAHSAKITNYVESANYITLTIDEALPSGLSAEDAFSILYLARLDTDVLNFSNIAPGNKVKVRWVFKELQEETP